MNDKRRYDKVENLSADRRRLLGAVEGLPRYTTKCRSRGTQIWVPLLAVQLLLQERVEPTDSGEAS